MRRLVASSHGRSTVSCAAAQRRPQARDVAECKGSRTLIPEFGILVGAGDPGPARHGAQIQADKPTSRQAAGPNAGIGDRVDRRSDFEPRQ